MPSRPLLSVLIVNYNTTELTHRCVASLQAQRLYRSDGKVESPHVVVVDNASRADERRALSGIGVRVVYNEENRGYGAALNQAVERTDSDFVLFSNSDTWYVPGALQTLVDEFSRLPRCGAVGPRLWWDREQTFLLPPSDPVTLTRSFFETMLGRSERGRRWLEHTWRERALQYWRTQKSLPQPMLSGASLLTHKEILAACGGFDEQFRLYYEDTDWCRRMRQKGYGLYYVPTADVIHLHNQSARQEVSTAQQAGKESEMRYFRKYYGKLLGGNVVGAATQWRVRKDNSWQPGDGVDLGTCIEPPVFSLPKPLIGEHLWQLSPLPLCVPAIARFLSTADKLILSTQVWAQLRDGEFFARLFSLPDLRLVQQWRWRKASSPV